MPESGGSRSANSCRHAIALLHETFVHRAMRDYVGAGLATVTEGVLISDRGDRCLMTFLPPNSVRDDLSSISIDLEGEPTPYSFGDSAECRCFSTGRDAV